MAGMNSIPPVVFLLAALLCSLIGRLMLVRAAWGVSTVWGLTVLAAPFGPFLFRLKDRALAQSGVYWRLASVPLVACFFFAGGTDAVRELDDLKFWEKQPAIAAETVGTEPKVAGNAPGAAAPAAGKRVTLLDRLLFAKKLEKLSDPTTAASVAPAPTPAATPALAGAPASPAPSATPAAIASPVIATLTPPIPIPMTLAERAAANQQEFKRLEDVYESLKRERGYLRKGDQAAVVEYNAAAARYQAALAKARAEQTELMKLVAKK